MTGLDAAAIGAFLTEAGVDQWGVARNRVPEGVSPAATARCAPSGSRPTVAGRRRPTCRSRCRSACVSTRTSSPRSWTVRPRVLRRVQALERGPHRVAATLAGLFTDSGSRAMALESTVGGASVADWTDAGVFPHKTAATQAGLGWIGKTALFVSPRLRPPHSPDHRLHRSRPAVGEPVRRVAAAPARPAWTPARSAPAATCRGGPVCRARTSTTPAPASGSARLTRARAAGCAASVWPSARSAARRIPAPDLAPHVPISSEESAHAQPSGAGRQCIRSKGFSNTELCYSITSE